jgi:hypothetical protein
MAHKLFYKSQNVKLAYIPSLQLGKTIRQLRRPLVELTAMTLISNKEKSI